MSSLFQPIYTQRVGAAGVASVTFNNIPQNFTDLKILISARASTANTYDNFNIRFNGSSAGYNQRLLYGTGTAVLNQGTVFTDRGFVCDITASTTFASTFANVELYISGYNNGNKKTYTVTSAYENNTTAAFLEITAGTWDSRQPITSLSLFSNGGNLVQHSTVTLYGILKPGNGPKASGGEITTDGRYWYHCFKTVGSSTFITNQNISVEALCVAGGGGGGRYGGGGGGGVMHGVSNLLTSGQSYTVTVGGGGTGNWNDLGGANYLRGDNGGNSQFLNIVAFGGGGGGSFNTTTSGSNGGSGGGSGMNSGDPGIGYYSQGFIGGIGTNNGSSYSGGGGGGSYALGAAATAAVGGAGGAGSNAWTLWGLTTGTGQLSNGLVFFSGGGGGATFVNADTSGLGGIGGGGTGGKHSSAVVQPISGSTGTVNTGGGGGGGYNGGSGVVIIRYPV
jgi:hypothetical protein